MRQIACFIVLLLGLGACAAPDQRYADDATLAKVRYRAPDGPKLTLYTMINNRTGQGAHSSLMVNASERVIFDPAGSFYSSAIPERNDVLHGITPAAEKAYRGAHARSSHHVIVQEIAVTPEQADAAYRRIVSNGPVAAAFCTSATSSVLKSVPGFEDVDVTFYPQRLAAQLETRPGVVTERYYENDNPDLAKTLADNESALALKDQ